jgi:hypothetical protein
MADIERKLATVRRIAKIDPIEGSDFLCHVTIDGWRLVASKSDGFQVNDLVLYFEIDSFLPVIPEFEFLRDRCFKSTVHLGDGFRLKTIRLRGAISQGLIMPLKDFVQNDDNGWFYEDYDPNKTGFQQGAGELERFAVVEGTDLTEFLGVKKWEAAPEGPGGSKFGPSQTRGSFPDFLTKTDQERVQNCLGGIRNWIYHAEPEYFKIEDAELLAQLDASNELLKQHPGRYFLSDNDWYEKKVIDNDPATIDARSKFEVTIKLDGSSMTAYINDGRFGVCSRNMDLKRVKGNAFWDATVSQRLIEWLFEDGRNLAVQGELMGPGIQGNKEGLKELTFFLFDIYDIDNKRYFTPQERLMAMQNASSFWYRDDIGGPMQHAPVIAHNFDIRTLNLDSVDGFLSYAEGPSLNAKQREGVVFKSCLEGGPSFKAISNTWLLKND